MSKAEFINPHNSELFSRYLAVLGRPGLPIDIDLYPVGETSYPNLTVIASTAAQLTREFRRQFHASDGPFLTVMPWKGFYSLSEVLETPRGLQPRVFKNPSGEILQYWETYILGLSGLGMKHLYADDYILGEVPSEHESLDPNNLVEIKPSEVMDNAILPLRGGDDERLRFYLTLIQENRYTKG